MNEFPIETDLNSIPTEAPNPAEEREASISPEGESTEFAEFIRAEDAVKEEQNYDEDIDVLLKIPPFPNPLRHPLLTISWFVQTLFGMASLVLLLAVVAAVPILNFIALGYLLKVEGQIAQSGKLRDALPLLGLAPRIGSMVIGIWLVVFPLRLLAGAASDAQIIDPGSTSDIVLHRLTDVAAVLAVIHICFALARGGRISCFFRPIKNVRWCIQQFRAGDYWQQAATYISDFSTKFRIQEHFSLGLRGFAGAFIWLFLPTFLYAMLQKTDKPGQIILTIFGGFLLLLVFSWIPFLQARFAAENRLRAMFELREIRKLYRNAPIAWLMAIIVVYVLALPLYLLKVALPPSDAMWLVTIVFIISIYPARVVTGWAYHRAKAKEEPAWFGWRWLSKLLMVPLLGLYVFLLFFTQTIGEHGKLVLFEHHAFLLPVPF